jgi:threonine/homoserine efflux transporter RhtA
MKFTTALAFVLSGVILYYIIRTREGEFDRAQVVLFVASLIIMLLMGTFLFSALLNVPLGLEDLFIKDAAGTARTIVPGRPSLPTMLNFILIALAGIVTLLNIKKLHFALKAIGLVVGLIGTVAVAGYIIGAPALYYYVEGINSAIAFHTAGLFVLLGLGLLCR